MKIQVSDLSYIFREAKLLKNLVNYWKGYLADLNNIFILLILIVLTFGERKKPMQGSVRPFEWMNDTDGKLISSFLSV